MKLTLTQDVIVNDGKRGIMRKSGDDVEVKDGDGKYLIAVGHAVPIQPVNQKQPIHYSRLYT